MAETRPSLGTSFSRTAARVRTRGPVEVAGALRGALGDWLRSEGHLKLLVRPASAEGPRRDDLSFSQATRGDGAAYARDIGTDSVETFRARLTAATDCYLVESEGRILHASWATTGRAWTAEIGGFIAPPPGDAYVYESFTHPDARGRGIYPFALEGITAALGATGIARVWVGVEADNVPSIRAIAKAGFTEAFDLRFRRRRGRTEILDLAGPEARTGETMIRLGA